MTDLSFLVGTWTPEARHRVAKHLIGYATIQYMERGKLFISYDRREYTVEGQWFWPAYPGPYTVFHRAPGCDSWSHRHIAFQGPLYNQWQASGLWLTEPQPAPPGRDWAAYFDEMRRLADMPNRWGRLRAINMLEGLLLELAEARSAPLATEPWLERVLLSLDSPEAEYGAIASEHGMALSTLRRRFLAATGNSLHEHRLLGKMAKARTMLSETDLPIKAISDDLGYQNVQFFTRQFTQFVGMPPARFRRTR